MPAVHPEGTQYHAREEQDGSTCIGDEQRSIQQAALAEADRMHEPADYVAKAQKSRIKGHGIARDEGADVAK